MFPPGSYTGLSNDIASIKLGLERQAKFIAKNGMPILIEADLNESFAHLGTYDLVVSTATLDYMLDVTPQCYGPIFHRVSGTGGRILRA